MTAAGYVMIEWRRSRQTHDWVGWVRARIEIRVRLMPRAFTMRTLPLVLTYTWVEL